MSKEETKKLYGYIFCGEILELGEAKKPVEISPYIRIEKPNLKDVRRILGYVTSGFRMNHIEFNPYVAHETIEHDGHKSYSKIENEEDYKYTKISYYEPLDVQKFCKSLELCSLKITPLIAVLKEIFKGEAIQTFGDTRISSFYSSLRLYPRSLKFTKINIEEINHIYSELEKFDYKRFPLVDKAVRDFSNLKNLPYDSPFLVVGIISILEMLLTHDSRMSGNSLNHQLQNKLWLLNNRFRKPVNFRSYFKCSDSVTFQKIIEKVYKYRSDIAHGADSDFNVTLDILGDSKITLQFIYEILRLVILQALEEPQLIMDLKNC